MDVSQNLGQIAFEAYRERMRKRTYDNKPIPEWVELSDNVRAGWVAAAYAVLNS